MKPLGRFPPNISLFFNAWILLRLLQIFLPPLAPPLLTFWSCNNADPCLYRGRHCCVKCHTLLEITTVLVCTTFWVWPLEPAKPNKPSPLSQRSSLSGALQSLIDWLMGRGRRVRLSVESSAGGSRLQSETISSRTLAPSPCMDGSICAHTAVSMIYFRNKFYLLMTTVRKNSFDCQITAITVAACVLLKLIVACRGIGRLGVWGRVGHISQGPKGGQWLKIRVRDHPNTEPWEDGRSVCSLLSLLYLCVFGRVHVLLEALFLVNPNTIWIRRFKCYKTSNNRKHTFKKNSSFLALTASRHNKPREGAGMARAISYVLAHLLFNFLVECLCLKGKTF